MCSSSGRRSRNFSGRFKVQVRDFDGDARMFRANVVRQGRSDLGPGFRRDKVWLDGKNSQTLGEHGFSAEMQYTLGDFRLISLTGGEWLDSFSRGDVDGGFGAVWSPPSGPGLIPFPSETADGVLCSAPTDSGSPAGKHGLAAPGLAGRLLLLPRGHGGRGLQLRHAGRQRAERLHPPTAAHRGLGRVRRGHPDADREA